MADEKLLAALNASLDGTDAETPDEEIEEGEGSSQELEASAEGEETPAEGEEAAEGEESAEGDGKPAAKKAEEKTPEQLAAEAAATAKPKDPVNDPLPNALKKETKERMESLITTVKAVTGERDKAVADQKEFMSHIEATGATPQQYSSALGYLGLVNSNDPVKQEQALQIMQQEVAALAKILGKPVPGVDMLSGHADLQEAVADGSISQQHAEELAASRERGKIQTAQSQHRQQVSQQDQQWAQEVKSGKDALTAVGNRLSADPQFEAKRAILVPALKATFAKSHPSTWAATFEAAYSNLKLAPTMVRQKTVVPGNQPLRAKAGAGGAVKQPGSMLEALNQGLGFSPGV